MPYVHAARIEITDTSNAGVVGFIGENSNYAVVSPLLCCSSMAGWKDFREIVAWQRAQRVRARVYVLLRRPEIRRDFEFCKQLRDAARSAPANIAEGFGRFGNKEFARFVRIAHGSQEEILNHLIDARDQCFLTEDELMIEEHYVKSAMAAASGLIRHLDSTPDPPRRRTNKNPEPRTKPRNP